MKRLLIFIAVFFPVANALAESSYLNFVTASQNKLAREFYVQKSGAPLNMREPAMAAIIHAAICDKSDRKAIMRAAYNQGFRRFYSQLGVSQRKWSELKTAIFHDVSLYLYTGHFSGVADEIVRRAKILAHYYPKTSAKVCEYTQQNRQHFQAQVNAKPGTKLSLASLNKIDPALAKGMEHLSWLTQYGSKSIRRTYKTHRRQIDALWYLHWYPNLYEEGAWQAMRSQLLDYSVDKVSSVELFHQALIGENADMARGINTLWATHFVGGSRAMRSQASFETIQMFAAADPDFKGAHSVHLQSYPYEVVADLNSPN